MTIAIIVRECTFLKILHPIMDELHNTGEDYILYHLDAPRGNKEYNRITLKKLMLSSPSVANNALKVKAFSSDKQLRKQLVHDNISKLVSLEVYLWAKKYIGELKKNSIKIYNILYLTDSLWSSDARNITTSDRVYYSSEYLMRLHLDLLGIKYNPARDRWLGSPAYSFNSKSANGTLILLPNMKKEHVGVAFGCKGNFIKIINNIVNRSDGEIVFKTRKKQWIPEELRKIGIDIVDDGDAMYPPIISSLLDRCNTVVMFYSSGIYESIYAGKYVVNIPINLKRWSWDSAKMNKYFKSDIYNYNGAVLSVSQEDAISGNFNISYGNSDDERREAWAQKYIGKAPINSAKSIVKDILS